MYVTVCTRKFSYFGKYCGFLLKYKKGGDFMKAKFLILILLTAFVVSTTFVLAGLNIQTIEGSTDFANSYNSLQVNDEFVQPTGIPIDCPSGPT
jgi:hypothetical protein